MPQSGEQPTYLGCFLEDASSPDLTGEPPLIITRPEACFNHCSIGTWSYAAIRNKTICTCGDTFSKYGTAPASMCTSACPEEQSVYDDCGGPEANSIYRVGLIGSKVPFPTPSIIQPTGPQPVISLGTDQTGDHANGSSRSAVISGTAAAVVVVGVVFVMLYRKRKTRSTYIGRSYGPQPKEMEETATRPAGHSWLSRSGSKEIRDRDDRDDDSNGHGRPGAQTVEAQLFEGFESSVMIEDHEHRPQYYNDRLKLHQGHRPSSSEDRTRTSSSSGPTMTSTSGTLAHATRLDSIQSHSSTASQQQPHQSRSNSVTQATQKVTQFATKLGQKLGHLRVKTHLSDPTSSHNLPVPPISPISPVSPTLPSPTKPHSETEPGTGGTTERNPASATPSFSSVSVPSVASNRHGQSTTRSEIPIAMPLSSSPTTCSSTEKQFLPKSPPSPISPTMASVSSPTSSSSLHHNPKFQKEHRSMLIKDLILQGDNALDEKEQALMAQYQPYHCQQQLLLQQQKQQQHQMKHHQKGPHRSSVATVDPSMETSCLTRQSSSGSGSRDDNMPAFAPTDAAKAQTQQQQQQQQQQRPPIPAIDTNYLAPPPRIYIHKPL